MNNRAAVSAVPTRTAGTFPIEAIRAQFPSLAKRDAGRARIYLDNPAGTQVPRRVSAAIESFFRSSNANLGGAFATSGRAQQTVHEAYLSAMRFLNAKSEREVVFGPSMTALTFTFSRSFARTFCAQDEIVLTRMDHEGNIAPWLAIAEERNLRVRWVPFDRATWRIEPHALESALSNRTRLVALNYASNMTGSINDIPTLAALAHAAGALVYVDAVQYAPHAPIDAPSLGCDMLVCSAYKFYGPHLAVLWGREELLESVHAYKVRPVPSTLPQRFEAGTPQLELIAAFGAAVAHFEWLGALLDAEKPGRPQIERAYQCIIGWERALTARLIEGLVQLAGVKVVGITHPPDFDHRAPTVSFTHAQYSSTDIAKRLAECGIFVWSGHNFALEAARALELDEQDGVVRIGLAHYNTMQEVETVLEALNRIVCEPAPTNKRGGVRREGPATGRP